MTATATGLVCPKCGSPNLWDNRAENAERVARGEKARPDWKCKDRNCDGVIWPPKGGRAAAPKPNGKQPISIGAPIAGLDDEPYGTTLPIPPKPTLVTDEAERFRGAVLWVVQEIEPILREKGIGMSDDVAYKFAFSLWKGRSA